MAGRPRLMGHFASAKVNGGSGVSCNMLLGEIARCFHVAPGVRAASFLHCRPGREGQLASRSCSSSSSRSRAASMFGRPR